MPPQFLHEAPVAGETLDARDGKHRPRIMNHAERHPTRVARGLNKQGKQLIQILAYVDPKPINDFDHMCTS